MSRRESGLLSAGEGRYSLGAGAETDVGDDLLDTARSEGSSSWARSATGLPPYATARPALTDDDANIAT
jgi:hypothetical protein